MVKITYFHYLFFLILFDLSIEQFCLYLYSRLYHSQAKGICLPFHSFYSALLSQRAFTIRCYWHAEISAYVFLIIESNTYFMIAQIVASCALNQLAAAF